MATRGKLEADVEVKSNADKFWGTIRDFVTVFPKAFPNDFKSIEILEGDGKAAGSVFHITCGEAKNFLLPGEGSTLVKSYIEKIEDVDDAKKTVTYDVTVINGDLLQYCKNFKEHISVTPKGDGSEVKWTAEYEKASQVVPDPTILKDFGVQSYLEVDAYIRNA